MSDSPIKTIGKYILVRLKEQEQTQIHVKDLKEREVDGIIEGTLVSRGVLCGEDIMINPDEEFPSLGETVLFKQYCGVGRKINGIHYRLLKDSDLVCIKKENEAIPLIPLGTTVLIEIKKVEEKSEGGILLPEEFVNSLQSMIAEGTVVAYSKSCAADYVGGKYELPAIGSTILYIKFAGFEHEVNGKCYKIINDEDLYGIPQNDYYASDEVK